MRRGLTIAALMAGFVAMSTLPAAAQGWGYYEGWSGPPRGFGISIGFGSPYYGDWGYGYGGPPAAYAYSAPAGYAYSAPVEYGYAGRGGPGVYGPGVYGPGVYGNGGPIYAYEPDYTYGPSYAYETYTTGPGYGWRRARVGARAEFSARERNVVRTQNRANARLGSNQMIRGEQTVGRGGAEMRGTALGRGPNRAQPSVAAIPAPAWARAEAASSKPDKSLHALNDCHGPVQRTGPCFAGHPGLGARERRRRAWEARGVTLHQPAAMETLAGPVPLFSVCSLQ